LLNQLVLGIPNALDFAVQQFLPFVRAPSARPFLLLGYGEGHKRFEDAEKSLLMNRRFPVDRIIEVGFQNSGDFVFFTVHRVSNPGQVARALAAPIINHHVLPVRAAQVWPSSIAHRFLVPIEVRPDIGTLSAARFANETRLQIGYHPADPFRSFDWRR
jgi:hypothetical protein